MGFWACRLIFHNKILIISSLGDDYVLMIKIFDKTCFF